MMKFSIAKHILNLLPPGRSGGGCGGYGGCGVRRFFQSRGFGIQSPWAYSFVTEVIGERWPYYAYTEIEQTYPRKEQKWQKLFHRIRNFTHPYPTVIIDNTANLTDNILDEAILKATTKGCIILRGINASPEAQQRFEHIKQRPDTGISFDLYHLAIIFLDTTIYKQHYKLKL